jgi:HPt (histidine-containing phosphotransfer) domain-containing protein
MRMTQPARDIPAMPGLDAAQPQVDGGRLKELAQMAGPAESHALLRELLEMYRAEAIPHLARLTAAWKAGEAALARSEAHYLAGSSANLGLTQLAEVWRELEALAKNGQLPAWTDLDGALEKWMGEACSAYEKAVAELAAG